MAAKRILLLDGPFLSAYHWSAGRIRAEGEFSHEPAGLEALVAYLKKHHASLFYLLADIAEEGFQLEDLPHVQGGDRAALLQRRLGQYYYSTPLSTAMSLGRATDGRRDEKVLFAALTRIETFTPWLDALRAAEAVLAGIYSVPLVLAGCVPQLVSDSGPVLVVSLTRGGVRQTFFHQNRLHFSRLSPLATHGIDEIGRTCVGDATKIFQYLVAQRQIPRGTTLRTCVIAHPDQMPALREYCMDSAELRFEYLDLVAAARQLGLKAETTDSSADKLLLHCLAHRTPDHQFAPEADRRFFRLWQFRFALTSAAWVAIAACMLYVGKTMLTVHDLSEAVTATRTATATETQRYNALLEGLPRIDLTTDNLRAITARLDLVQRRMPGMEPLLLHLSQALNEMPRIELTGLSWKLGERSDAGARSSVQAKAEPAKAPQATAGGNWAMLEIRAQLPLGLAADQRAQIDLIEGFAGRLRDSRTEVVILSRPFDIESDKPLRSAGDGDNANHNDAPKFSLRITRAS